MTAPVVIIGAHGGIGEALARRLARAGVPLFLTARDAQTIHDFPNAICATLDVTDAGQVADVIACADRGEGIAGLVYAVGSIALTPFARAREDDYLKAYDLNVMGAVRVLQAARAGLEVAGGSVVLFSTIAVQQGFSNHTVISTAKGAVEGLTRALAAEWAGKIRVNAIAPSLTDTPLASSLTQSESMAKTIAALHPIPRLGRAEDMAALAQFLLSSDSGWITGQVLHVDGGRTHLRVKG